MMGPKRMIRTRQSGFSLIELAISVAITSVAIVAAITLLVLSARRAGALSEASEANNTQTVLGELLRADFEASGTQLVISRPFTGGQVAPQFTGNAAYQVTNDGTSVTITKVPGG